MSSSNVCSSFLLLSGVTEQHREEPLFCLHPRHLHQDEEYTPEDQADDEGVEEEHHLKRNPRMLWHSGRTLALIAKTQEVVGSTKHSPESNPCQSQIWYNKSGHSRKSLQTVSQWLTSHLRHIFQAGQAVHGADDIPTVNFKSQVHSMSICGPQLYILIYYNKLKYPSIFH